MEHQARSNDDADMDRAAHDAKQNSISRTLVANANGRPKANSLVHQRGEKIRIIAPSIGDAFIFRDVSAKAFIDDKAQQAVAVETRALAPAFSKGKPDVMGRPVRQS